MESQENKQPPSHLSAVPTEAMAEETAEARFRLQMPHPAPPQETHELSSAAADACDSRRALQMLHPAPPQSKHLSSHTCLHCVSPANTAPSTTTRNARAGWCLRLLGGTEAHALLMCLGKSWTRRLDCKDCNQHRRIPGRSDFRGAADCLHQLAQSLGSHVCRWPVPHQWHPGRERRHSKQ